MAASGLRPAAAFVGVATVLSVVALRSSWLQSFAEGAQPDAVRERLAPTADFEIVDRTGRSLAASVECFDLTISPRSMWRSHTPDHMAKAIAAVLDDPDGEHWNDRRVLERSMPFGFAEGMLPGRLAPENPALLWFEETDLDSVRSWLATGESEAARGRASDEDRDTMPVRGLSLVTRTRDEALHGAGPRSDDGAPRGESGAPVWTLAMEPVACLGREARAEQLPTRTRDDGTLRVAPPERWTRRLLDDLIGVVGRDTLIERLDAEQRVAFDALGRMSRVEFLRDVVWAELMPTRFRVVARSVEPVRAHALRELMNTEAVSPWQLQLVARTERRHPTRPGGVPTAPDPVADFSRTSDAFGLLGHWGVLDADRATARAIRDRELRPHVLPWDTAENPFDAYRESLIVDQRPWSGVELLCQTELENGPWATIARATAPRKYTYRLRHVARDRRRAWDGGVPNYFDSAAEATDTPRIEVTLDAHLQETLHAELGRMMDVHRPALAMGIVIDVENGDVLALGSRSAYAYSGFPPLLHVFTPGSTFKAVVMALALDAGVTTPDEMFPTYAGRGLTVGSRTIREAEGAPEEARITAAAGLAHSCNAVLVQIALRMDARDLRERILRLGYDQPTNAGLGHERAGGIPKLTRGTWRKPYEHASVGFGHEIGTTLWQHATALATLLRGGEFRPLRLVRSIERDGDVWERDEEVGEQVIGEGACRLVRDMMAMGAEEGTGRHVGRREDNPGLEFIATKTGTTEKVPTELCVHLELEALAEAGATGRAWTKADRSALFSLEKPHRRGTCYTSSMCALGRGEVDGEMREIMVLVVADDPTGSERFGSKVTGPTTLRLLRRSFGLEPTKVHAVGAEARGPVARMDESEGASREDATASPALRADWLDEDLPWAAETDEEPIFAEDVR